MTMFGAYFFFLILLATKTHNTAITPKPIPTILTPSVSSKGELV